MLLSKPRLHASSRHLDTSEHVFLYVAQESHIMLYAECSHVTDKHIHPSVRSQDVLSERNMQLDQHEKAIKLRWKT